MPYSEEVDKSLVDITNCAAGYRVVTLGPGPYYCGHCTELNNPSNRNESFYFQPELTLLATGVFSCGCEGCGNHMNPEEET